MTAETVWGIYCVAGGAIGLALTVREHDRLKRAGIAESTSDPSWRKWKKLAAGSGLMFLIGLWLLLDFAGPPR